MSQAAASLSTEDRAAVAAALLLAGARAPDVLARLAGARGERCAAAARASLKLAREERARLLAEEAARLSREVPAGLAMIHASWLEAAVAGESDAVRAVVAGGGSSSVTAPVRAWLRRAALGQFVDMPPADGDSVAAAPPERLATAIETIGRRRLAIAVQAAPAGAAVALAARLGSEHRQPFAEEARAPAGKDQISAAVRELADLVGGSAPLLLFRAGARHIAGALAAEGDLLRQVAQRVPRERGLVLLDERDRPLAGGVDLLKQHLGQIHA